MNTLELSSAKQPLLEFARKLNGATLVLTRKGKPVAALMPLKNVDMESVALSTNPRFLKIIERSRAQGRAGKGIPADVVRRRLGLKPK